MVQRPGFCYSWTKLLKFLQDSQKKKRAQLSENRIWRENCLVHKPSESCFEAQIAFSLRKGWWPDHQTSIYWIRDEIKSHPKGRNWISCPVLNGQCLVQEKHHFCQNWLWMQCTDTTISNSTRFSKCSKLVFKDFPTTQIC